MVAVTEMTAHCCHQQGRSFGAGLYPSEPVCLHEGIVGGDEGCMAGSREERIHMLQLLGKKSIHSLEFVYHVALAGHAPALMPAKNANLS